MQHLTNATLWESFWAHAHGAPMHPAHAPDVQLRVVAPMVLLHAAHAGRMLFRRYVPPWQPGTIRSTVMVASVSSTPQR